MSSDKHGIGDWLRKLSQINSYAQRFVIGKLVASIFKQIKQGENIMISSGYTSVPRKLIDFLNKGSAISFVREMFNHGGRIGYHEYQRWMDYIKETK